MKLAAILPLALLISAAPTKREILPDPAAVTHMVVCPDGMGRATIGTGFYIDRHLVATAAHVAGSRSCFIEGEPATIVYFNGRADLAILRTEEAGGGRIAISCRKPRNNAMYHSYGFPRAEHRQMRVFGGTKIRTPWTDPEFSGMALFAGAATPGQSGSAVLDDRGRAIGMLNATDENFMFSRLLIDTYLCR